MPIILYQENRYRVPNTGSRQRVSSNTKLKRIGEMSDDNHMGRDLNPSCQKVKTLDQSSKETQETEDTGTEK